MIDIAKGASNSAMIEHSTQIELVEIAPPFNTPSASDYFITIPVGVCHIFHISMASHASDQ